MSTGHLRVPVRRPGPARRIVRRAAGPCLAREASLRDPGRDLRRRRLRPWPVPPGAPCGRWEGSVRLRPQPRRPPLIDKSRAAGDWGRM